ncbi:MAG: type II 3-dehydroquinate dehydratase [Verrucomicrobia bacterium]|nr:type II 3-dehydroquinate dehydratase [Verrucomicrobiota bacterium]
MEIGVINGPNLDRLGKREPEVYGKQTLADLEKLIAAHAKAAGAQTRFFQSNHEGKLIDTIAKWADDGVKFLVINPGGHTHVSVALRDSIAGSSMQAVEVHISNIYKREEFRHKSVTASACEGVITGLGFDGYLLAVDFLVGTKAPPAKAAKGAKSKKK